MDIKSRRRGYRVVDVDSGGSSTSLCKYPGIIEHHTTSCSASQLNCRRAIACRPMSATLHPTVNHVPRSSRAAGRLTRVTDRHQRYYRTVPSDHRKSATRANSRSVWDSRVRVFHARCIVGSSGITVGSDYA